MLIYLSLNENNRVDGWSSSGGLGTDEVQLELVETHEFFSDPFIYRYENGELILDKEFQLEQIKKYKSEELKLASRNAILNGFTHMVNETEYHFPYDENDQINFGDAKAVLQDGVVTEVPWTVYTLDGKHERIMIDNTLMNELTVAVMNHKNGKIAHYRDVLLPQVESATTIEEVNAINWNL